MPRNKPKPEPTVSRETIAGWHARRGALLAKLHAQPQSQWAWLWQVHVDIADYLIHRYAGGAGGAVDPPQVDKEASSAAPEAGPLGTVDDGASEPYLPRLHGSARVAKAASLEGPDAERVRATLRDRLSSLHATNDARRASEPPIRPNLPPARYRVPSYVYGPPPEHERLMPMPDWLSRVLYMPLAWPVRLAAPAPSSKVIDQQWQSMLDELGLIRRTTFPEEHEPDGMDFETHGIAPYDDESLDLLRQAIVQDTDTPDPDRESLTSEEIMRILGVEDAAEDNGET